MKKNYLLSLLLAISALGCTSDVPSPSRDITQLNGSYRTNALLDLSCVAISDERQLPTLSVTKEAGGTYRLTRTDYIPSERKSELTGVSVKSVPDTLLIFLGNKRIGSMYLGRWPEVKGKKIREVTGSLVLVSNNDTTTPFFFYGYKQ